MKGWYRNPMKHSLASKGISTKEIRDIIQFPEIIDYSDMEEIIIAFWIANRRNNYSNFNFDKAFKTIEKEMEEFIKIQVPYKDISLRELFEQFNTKDSEKVLRIVDADEDLYLEFEQQIPFSAFEILSELDYVRNRNKGKYDKFLINETKKTLGIFNKKFYDILLMDRVIDMQHHKVSVFLNKKEENIMIEELREKFDKQAERSLL